jgi:hypothetical protein
MSSIHRVSQRKPSGHEFFILLASLLGRRSEVMELQEKVNVFLDRLRESGETNMFGAAPYVSDAFGVSRNEAKDLVKNWMQTFAERHPQ